MRHSRLLGGMLAAALAATMPVHAADALARCSGAEEVPARETKAHGLGVFELSEDGQTVDYNLLVANIENVVAAHIHQAPTGVNGPVVVALFLGGVPGSGRVNGVLAQGSFTAASFVGPLAGLTMDALLDDIANGNAYVNIHTNDGVGPTNTGPGDFASGEIRGQVRLTDD